MCGRRKEGGIAVQALIDGVALRSDAWCRDYAEAFVSAAVKVSGLNLISGPYSGEHEGEITAIAILAESHAIIHLWPVTCRFAVDLFTCRAFSLRALDRLIAFTFEPKTRNTQITERGDDLATIGWRKAVPA